MKDEVERYDLRSRTRRFSLSIIRFFETLPASGHGQILGRQLLRSATSVGAHYHEGHRSRSVAEFISKLETALQELEETRYWLLLITESRVADEDVAAPLLKEADELTAIFVTSVKKLKISKSKV